jgi:hypothetical protein
VAGHLGAAAAPFEALADADLAAAENRGPGTPLPPHLGAFLRELYLPRIEALETALGRDLAAWKACPDD